MSCHTHNTPPHYTPSLYTGCNRPTDDIAPTGQTRHTFEKRTPRAIHEWGRLEKCPTSQRLCPLRFLRGPTSRENLVQLVVDRLPQAKHRPSKIDQWRLQRVARGIQATTCTMMWACCNLKATGRHSCFWACRRVLVNVMTQTTLRNTTLRHSTPAATALHRRHCSYSDYSVSTCLVDVKTLTTLPLGKHCFKLVCRAKCRL